MSSSSVVASLVLSVTTLVCIQPALGPRVATSSPAPATPIPYPLLDALDRLDDLEATVARLQSRVADERVARQRSDQILAGVIVQLLDGLKHFSRVGDDIYITGANLHIVNGTGTTDGPTNSVGNLIIGYNESRTLSLPNDRTGSHMLVVGKENNYSSFGGIVVGFRNSTSGVYSSVSGGAANTASGDSSFVSGGVSNTASRLYASVSGGRENTACAYASSVSGGLHNLADGPWSSVSGGQSNTASGLASSVSGGEFNTASGEYSSVSGGQENTAGPLRHSSVSGGFRNTASGEYSSVSAGRSNMASGDFSSVSGGLDRMAAGRWNWVAGMLFQDM